MWALGDETIKVITYSVHVRAISWQLENYVVYTTVVLLYVHAAKG